MDEFEFNEENLEKKKTINPEELDDNFKVKKHDKNMIEKMKAILDGLKNSFREIWLGSRNVGYVLEQENPILRIKKEKLIKEAAKKGEQPDFTKLYTKRDEKMLAQEAESRKAHSEKIFGNKTTPEFNTVYMQLRVRDFDMNEIKKSNLLNVDFSNEKNSEIAKNLILEMKKIKNSELTKQKQTQKDINEGKETKFTPMTEKEQQKQAIKNVMKKLQICEDLWLDVNEKNMFNINLAFENGYQTTEDIKKIIGGAGEQKMSNIKEAIAKNAIINGTPMVEIDSRGISFEVDPKSLFNVRESNASKENNIDSLIAEMSESKMNDQYDNIGNDSLDNIIPKVEDDISM